MISGSLRHERIKQLYSSSSSSCRKSSALLPNLGALKTQRQQHRAQHRALASKSPLDDLVQQAQAAPVIRLPSAASSSAAAPLATSDSISASQHTGPKPLKSNKRRSPSINKQGRQQHGPDTASLNLWQQSAALGMQQTAAMPAQKLRPSRMNFDILYEQLCAWRQHHMSAHVPRYCFDAPELGAWVRHLRKQYKDGKLEQWKVERLNELSFEWELTDQDAKWYHCYHQLRRYKLMYGTTQVNPANSSIDGCDWLRIVMWLKQQGRLFAKQKLSGQKKALLGQLGVTLHLPKRLVQRTAQLQALNGPERRKLRKKWKKLDQGAVEKEWRQQQQQLQQLREEQRLQQQVVLRRLSLLEAAETFVANTPAEQLNWLKEMAHSSQGCSSSSSSALQSQPQQYQQWQQQEHYLSQQQQPSDWQAAHQLQQQQPRQQVALHSHEHNGEVMQQQLQCKGKPPDNVNAASKANGIQQQQLPQPQQQQPLLVQPEQQQQQQQPDSQQRQQSNTQQQQQQQAAAVFFERNRRSTKRKQRTKHEQWLTHGIVQYIEQ